MHQDPHFHYRQGHWLLQVAIVAIVVTVNTTLSAAPVVLALADLKEVRLARAASARAPLADGAKPQRLMSVTLANGDHFAGKLVEITDQVVVLETAYAGTLRLARARVRLVQPEVVPVNYVYQGPTSLEGWVMSRGKPGTWSYANGALIATDYGFIGRDSDLPDMVNVEFDLAGDGDPIFSVNLYADGSDSPHGSGYMLSALRDHFHFARYDRHGSHDIGEFRQPDFMARGEAHFALRVDKVRKSIAVFINGVLCLQCTDSYFRPVPA